MAYQIRDNRDDSDLRADALADGVICLLAQKKLPEALALLYDIPSDLLGRVWTRLQPDGRNALTNQAQAGREIPDTLQKFLAQAN